jgi:hypothetical protein
MSICISYSWCTEKSIWGGTAHKPHKTTDQCTTTTTGNNIWAPIT